MVADFEFTPVAMPPVPAPAPAAPADEHAGNLMDFELVVPAIEPEPAAQPEVIEAVPVAPEPLPLAGISLDLDTGEADRAPGDAHATEMNTKLDLAVAYRDIGDLDGARELLDEVIKAGAPEQVERATALRKALG